MSYEVVKGSIKVRKLVKPVVHAGTKYNYEVGWVEYPYGKKSPMRKLDYELAKTKKDAEEWKKVLMKDVV